MYTRSYASKGIASTRIPPDYGGTALVIRQETPEDTANISQTPSDPVPAAQTARAAERSPRRRAATVPHGDTGARYPISYPEAQYKSSRGLEVRSPFGDKAQSELDEAFMPTEEVAPQSLDGDSVLEASAVASVERNNEHKGVFGSIFSPETLKSDDLLLLGLMFLLFEEGGNGREALLILAVLYLSGQ